MLRPYRFPYAFLGSLVRLAKEIHSLVRFSKRTTELRLPFRPTGGSPLGRFEKGLSSPVALSPTGFMPYCTALLGVLFSVRSRYLFAIGLEECLAFAVDARVIHEGYPTPATLVLAHTLLNHGTGLSPCFVLCSKRLLVICRVLSASPNTTFPCGFGLGCVAFTRGYLRHRSCFLFLSLLRCFNSGRSPLRKAIVEGFPFGDPQFFASMQLPEAYRSLARPSSALEPSNPSAGIVAVCR